MRVFTTRVFTRFARKTALTEDALCNAIRDAENGLIAANLGGGVIKQRIARPGSGKSGGFRTLIVFKSGEKAFFVHGFAKNERDNISSNELTALKKLATELLSYDDAKIAAAMNLGMLLEVCCYEKTVS